MRYSAEIRRGDDTTFTSKIDTTAGDERAVALAINLADSYGATLVSLTDDEGKEIPVGDDTVSSGSGTANDASVRIEEQNKDTEERVDEQDKTTTERVDEQKVETRDVKPNKTGDVKPDR